MFDVLNLLVKKFCLCDSIVDLIEPNTFKICLFIWPLSNCAFLDSERTLDFIKDWNNNEKEPKKTITINVVLKFIKNNKVNIANTTSISLKIII
tara:strand:+ start:873 stop:1154 length:282 start_codon:yes stop_codon:yes gene_type:complete